MKVDVCATETQYLAHMLPIWAALPGELRGEVHPLGTVGHPPRPRKGRVALVAGWQDVHPLRGLCDMIYVEHGAGQTYSDNPNQPSYSGSGGQRHQGVIGYISPNSTVAARWKKPAAAVGCPKMDHWRIPPTPPKPAVCFAWHWMCTVAPETKSAWPHYSSRMGEVIERYRDQGFEVLIHEHPRWRGKLVHEWSERFDVEVLRSDVEVFERASILMVDNSSLGMEFMLLDRPVVWLNAPWYRRDVHHGGRFWEWTDGVPCIDHPEALLRLNLWDVNAWQVDPTVDTRSHQWAHARRTYEFVDGGASMRAAAFIAQLLEGK